jgi:hypothetical protein
MTRSLSESGSISAKVGIEKPQKQIWPGGHRGVVLVDLSSQHAGDARN